MNWGSGYDVVVWMIVWVFVLMRMGWRVWMCWDGVRVRWWHWCSCGCCDCSGGISVTTYRTMHAGSWARVRERVDIIGRWIRDWCLHRLCLISMIRIWCVFMYRKGRTGGGTWAMIVVMIVVTVVAVMVVAGMRMSVSVLCSILNDWIWAVRHGLQQCNFLCVYVCRQKKDSVNECISVCRVVSQSSIRSVQMKHHHCCRCRECRKNGPWVDGSQEGESVDLVFRYHQHPPSLPLGRFTLSLTQSSLLMQSVE